jgi:hypothetical protein
MGRLMAELVSHAFAMGYPAPLTRSSRSAPETSAMPKTRARAIKAGRRAISRGVTPQYEVDIRRREVREFPWLEFDGSGPSAIAEAARRAIAAELGVRAHEVEVRMAVAGEAEQR